MIILRTSPETIQEVVRLSKHALDYKPRLTKGELILISQNTVFGIRDDTPPIRYVMEFDWVHLDTSGESMRIWGRQWEYIIEGKNCRSLKHPFDISNHQVTEKNYGPGGPLVYVAPDDERVLQQKGLLETD